MSNDGKVSRSFSIPGYLDEIMRDRQDVNWSGHVSQFLEELVENGQSTEAAIATRLNAVESQLADASTRVEQLHEEKQRLRDALEDRKERRREVFDSFQSLDFNGNLDPTNGAVKRHAEKVGMDPRAFIEQYQEWSK